MCARERETVGRPVSSSLGSFFFFCFLFCVLFVFVLCVSFSSWVDSGRRRKVKLRVAGLFRLLLLFFFFLLPDHQPKHRLLLLEFPVRCGSCCSRNTRRDELLLLLPPFLNDVSLYLYIYKCVRACVWEDISATRILLPLPPPHSAPMNSFSVFASPFVCCCSWSPWLFPVTVSSSLSLCLRDVFIYILPMLSSFSAFCKAQSIRLDNDPDVVYPCSADSSLLLFFWFYRFPSSLTEGIRNAHSGLEVMLVVGEKKNKKERGHLCFIIIS